MKQIFFIPPVSAMDLSEHGTHNLFVIGQRYKSDEKYREYVHKAKQDGRFLILDNGVGDEGEILTNEEVYALAKELQPDEVIPTDDLYNKTATILHTQDMISWLKRDGLLGKIHIFMCPQGNTLEEWVECYTWALNNPDVSTIGMSKKTIPHILFNAKPDELIAEARNMMYDILEYRGLLGKPLHMLGSAGPKEYEHYKYSKWVRSTDSCIAIWAGYNKVKFDSLWYKRIPTPKNYFDLKLDEEQREYALYNINNFKNIL